MSSKAQVGLVAEFWNPTPAIGFLAASFGLPAALTTLAFLSATAATIAYATRHIQGRQAGPG